MKLQRGRTLTRPEKLAVSALRSNYGTDDVSDEDAGFAERALKRARLADENDTYVLLGAVSPTSNIPERVFSMSSALIGLDRFSLHPIMIEATLFLKCNRSYRDVSTVHETLDKTRKPQIAVTKDIGELFDYPDLPVKLRQDLYVLTRHHRVVINKLRAQIPEAKNSDARNAIEEITDLLIHRNDQIEELIEGVLDRKIQVYHKARIIKAEARPGTKNGFRSVSLQAPSLN
ncbi:hypothetical protein H257_09479 [Aphanomyces astaci]|uniref:HAT C-terminal dimerisation domain-containing protein n=1 Tax=Aphanomyces astaci TaxID=112090 RepID=W4G9W1_APHAT|nr:hypothetical protein H257_09479 [Aphanomyces astaci]ETV76460.1 hypothetical protein H257_09479 [Aphanomyces astaci]|eukprot:XP_009834005.1 hypothetical protein H257_09479 [Aphanomyces astaci]